MRKLRDRLDVLETRYPQPEKPAEAGAEGDPPRFLIEDAMQFAGRAGGCATEAEARQMCRRRPDPDERRRWYGDRHVHALLAAINPALRERLGH